MELTVTGRKFAITDWMKDYCEDKIGSAAKVFDIDPLTIEVVEAKDNKHQISDGIQQAIDYARILDLSFAYSSNGDGFYEHDLVNGRWHFLNICQVNRHFLPSMKLLSYLACQYIVPSH